MWVTVKGCESPNRRAMYVKKFTCYSLEFIIGNNYVSYISLYGIECITV